MFSPARQGTNDRKQRGTNTSRLVYVTQGRSVEAVLESRWDEGALRKDIGDTFMSEPVT